MTPIIRGHAARLGLRKPHLRIEAAMDRVLIEASRGDSQLRRLLFEGKEAAAAWRREMDRQTEAIRAGVDRRANVLLLHYERAFKVLKDL